MRVSLPSFMSYTVVLFYCRYAFGLLVWCLLSGRSNAWSDENGRLPSEEDVRRRVLEGLRPDVDAIRRDAPAQLITLLHRCWAQQPSQRPHALDVTKELDILLAKVSRDYLS